MGSVAVNVSYFVVLQINTFNKKQKKKKMESASTEWQADKLHAAQLLSVSGQTFLDALPNMLDFWMEDTLAESSCRHSDEDLAFELLTALSGSSLELGNDVAILRALPDVLRRVNGIPDNTLRMRYEQAKELLGPDTADVLYPGDVSHVDQLLVPALLGGSIPLRVSHAQEVRKHILRDDDVSATKLVAVYSTKNDGAFSARLPHGFVPDGAIRRVVLATSSSGASRKALFGAMKTMGCLGEGVFSEVAVTSRPRGFKVYKGVSLAVAYATAVDNELEAPVLEL